MSDELTEQELEVKSDTEVDETEFDEVEDESNEQEGEESSSTPDETKDLQVKLDELEQSNKGLIQSLSAQRGLRQGLQDQLDEIKDAIVVSKEANAETADVEVDTSVAGNIPVDFDDDGNMSIDKKHIAALMNTDDLQSLQTDLNQVKNVLHNQHIETQEKNTLNVLLSEKEGYKGAYKEVTGAWDYMKSIFDPYLAKHSLGAPVNADQAIDMILQSDELTTSFTEKYPTLNLESVVEAHLIATPRYLRKALDSAITIPDSSHEALNLNRPSSLANANSGGSNTPESLLSKVADMSTEDYENLDASTIAKIDKLLEKAG